MRWLLFLILSLSAQAQTNVVIYETNILVQTYAGTGVWGHQNGQADIATFAYPESLATDSHGNLFVAEENQIRKISTNKTVTTLAYLNLRKIACDPFGNVWGINWDTGAVYKIYPSGDYVSPFGLASRFGNLAVDSIGNVFIADMMNHVIKKFDTNSNLSVFAGVIGISGYKDGCGTNANFSEPGNITIDKADNLYVNSYYYKAIRKITPQGCVTTHFRTTDTSGGYIDGNETIAKFYGTEGIVLNENGSILLAAGSAVRKIMPEKIIITVAGSASSVGYADGIGSEALFRFADGIAVSDSGVIFVADFHNHRIRRIVISDPPRISLGIFPVLTIDAIIGRQYRIESSSNLTNWITNTTITATDSPHLWIDQSSFKTNKFYRAVLLP